MRMQLALTLGLVNSSLADGTTLTSSPTLFTVQFDEPVDLPQTIFDVSRITTDRWTDAFNIIGSDGAFVGMSDFGASAPYKELYKHFGITPERVAGAALHKLGRK